MPLHVYEGKSGKLITTILRPGKRPRGTETVAILKRIVPVAILAWLDSLAQWTGNFWQLSPSVFVKSQVDTSGTKADENSFFQCPECDLPLPDTDKDYLECNNGHRWGIIDGIYDFKAPLD